MLALLSMRLMRVLDVDLGVFGDGFHKRYAVF